MSTNISLKQQVSEEIPWLFRELGLQITDNDFNPKSFGDSFVILESPALRVRFVRDRGQVSVEVASLADPRTWWHLEHVCEVISGQTAESGFELSAAADLLRRNFKALTDYLGSKYNDTKQELERRAEIRKRAFLKRFSG
jgi:hypothetical protein